MTTSGFPPFPGAPGATPGGAPSYAPPAQGFAAPPAHAPGFATPSPAPGFAPTGFPAGAAPYPQAAAEPAFVLHIPADPTWQPIEGGDTLDKDGFYCAKIASEKVRSDDGKLQVIFTLELQDDDVMGKKVSKFLPDPRQTTKDTWFLWRGLMRSIYGSVQHGQQSMDYSPGAFTGAFVYVKTEAYNDTRGTMRTGVGTWSTREEWDEARRTNRHRWPAKVSGVSNPGVGVLPGGQAPGFGLPGSPGGSGLPGAPSMGLPGAPSMPPVPQPGAAPMQTAPAANPFPPMQSVPAPAQGGFGFPPAAVPPAPATSGFPPPPPANGVPQPSAAGIAGSFPGAPPR